MTRLRRRWRLSDARFVVLADRVTLMGPFSDPQAAQAEADRFNRWIRPYLRALRFIGVGR